MHPTFNSVMCVLSFYQLTQHRTRQPLDRGIIRAFKARYRRHVPRYLVSRTEDVAGSAPDLCKQLTLLHTRLTGCHVLGGVITPNQIPLTTIVTYLQKSYRSRISNHWATIPACSVVPPIYKKSKKTYCHISF